MSENAWGYIVVSTDKQAETLADQLAWVEQAAELGGWDLTKTFGLPKDGKGVSSGAAGARALLEDLLSELEALPKAKRPKRILMTRLDRTGRGLGLEPMAAFAKIHALGVMVHTREDGDNAIHRASDVLKPVLRILTGALENEARSDKWKATHARRRAQGLHIGKVPFGVVLQDGKAVAYAPEAELVRELFERASNGWGYARLARWARERRSVKRLDDGTDKPYAWAPSSVKSILYCKTLRGVVVTEEVFEQMRAARALDFRARSPQRWPWPLQGAVRCTCGKMLSGSVAGGNTKYATRYYICRYHTLEPGQRSHPSHRADHLEAAFVAVLGRLGAEPSLVLDAEARDTHAIKARERAAGTALADLERRRQTAWTLAESAGLSGTQLRQRLDDIDGERTALQAELAHLQRSIEQAARIAAATHSLAQIVADLGHAWTYATTEQRQEIARAVSSLPAVNGLYASPDQRGKLIVGSDATTLQITDAFRSIAACAQLAHRLVTTVVP